MSSLDTIDEDTPSTFVIIPVHNRKSLTMRCLDRLAAQGDLDSFQIVIIDDGSSDGTADAIRTQYPQVHILQGDGNLWWTGAIALGMKYAYEQEASHFIWLNDDCLVPANTLANLVDFVAEQPKAIIGAQGYADHERNILAFGGKRSRMWQYEFFRCQDGEVAPCEMLSGNLVCIPRAVVASIGLPSQALPHYGGDTLYLIKARQAGFQLFVDARTAPIDLPGESALQPRSWLLQQGKPLDVISLIFTPQSILSWRVWWVLLTADYKIWGVFVFIAKYFRILPKLILFSILRFLPLEFREKIMTLKDKFYAFK